MFRSGVWLGWSGWTSDARWAILRPGPNSQREVRVRVYDIDGKDHLNSRDVDGDSHSGPLEMTPQFH